MFGSWVLEVTLGLIFVFLLFSTICAAVREGIEAWTKTRAAYLEHGVRTMLHDVSGSDLARKFYEHPLIYSLYSGKYEPGAEGDKVQAFAGGGNLPSYIPAKNFAAAMIDIAARGPLPSLAAGSQTADSALSRGPITAESLRAGIATMDNQRVARVLLNALDLAQDDLNKTRLNLETWYDSGMDRVSGWYKRSTQWIVFWLALAAAVLLNVDAIGIANFLYRNDNARHVIVAEAEAAVAEMHASAASTQVNKKQKDLDQLRKTESVTAEKQQAVVKAVAAAAEGRKDEQAVLAQARVARLPAEPATTGTALATPGAAPQAAAEKAEDAATSTQKYDHAKMKLDALELPIGWQADIRCPNKEKPWQCVGGRALSALGWLLTALAATLGAPFWFDILNKVMVIRSTVKPYEKSKPEGSEDRQNADQSLALSPVLRQLAGAIAPAGAAAQSGAASAGAASAKAAAAPPDSEAAIDGCEPRDDPVTPDDQLPPADGGVLR